MSCIILTHGFTVIDLSRTSGWSHADSGRLFRKLDTTMSGGFDPETFKAQLKEEMYTENKAMMKELLGEMTKLFKEKQPAQSSDPIDLDTELPIREREEDKVTVLADPIKQKNVGQTESVERPVWAKHMTKTMAQVQIMMK